MPDSQPITPESRLQDLLRDRPGAREVLESHGIDLCCGGSLTLAQAAGVRGVPVERLLRAFEGAPPGKGGGISGSDSIREILAAHPATAPVFARHGLLGCGGAAGPDEQIDFFAAAHRLDPVALLRELNAAAGPGAPEPAAQPVPVPVPVTVGAGFPRPEPAHLFVPFLRAALASTVTLGATFGAYNLLVIHWALGENPPSHNWVHAGFQIWGFVFLSIVGISTHTIPRFLGEPLAHAGALRHAWWITLAAQVLIGWGRLGELVPGTVAAAGLGPVLQLAAVGLWARSLHRTWRRSGAPMEAYHRFLALGTLSWLAAAGALVAGGIEAVLEGDAEAAVRWNQSVYGLSLFGGALGWIQGFLLRVGPVFLGLRGAPRAWSSWSLALGPLSVAALAAGSLAIRRPWGLPLMDAGLLGVALSLGIYLAALRPFSKVGTGAPAPQQVFRRWASVAIGFALLFCALAALYAVRSLSGLSAPGILLDGARHAFAAGFVTLLILSFAGRVLPVFLGRDLHRPGLLSAGLALLAAGVLLRQAQVLAPVFHDPVPLRVSGLSGIVAAVGIMAAVASLWGTLRSPRAEVRPQLPPGSIGPDLKISVLLQEHPEALPILVRAGFTPLANPVMRRMMGSLVTLRQACGMHGIELEPLLEQLGAGAAPAAAKASLEAVPVSPLVEALRGIEDPELSASIVDLGLIYGASRNPGGEVEVRMTLTEPGCPHGEALVDAVRRTLSALPGVERVQVLLVFEPRWSPGRMSPALRARMGVS